MSTTRHRIHATPSARARSLALMLALGGCGAESGPAITEGPRSSEVTAHTEQLALRSTDFIDLYSFWNPALGDNALSTVATPPAPGYSRYRTEGKLARPDLPQPPGMVPLYTWHSPSRGDYFSTSHPGWAGRPGAVFNGYNFVRMEGYVFENNVAGTTELELWWDPTREDNFTTSDPEWTRDADGRHAPSYGRAGREGYVLRSTEGPAPLSAFHHGTMGGGPRGERDVVVIQVNYRGAPFRHSSESFEQLFFGPGFPNLIDYTRDVSNGQFTWRKGGNWRVDAADDADTLVDEGNYRNLFDPAEPTMVLVGLQAPAGDVPLHVGAADGGGAGTMLSTNLLEWEVFNLVDENGGLLVSGDVVSFKTYSRHFLREAAGELRADATVRTSSAARFTAIGESAGVIGPGARLRLRSVATGTYVRQTASGLDVRGLAGHAAGLFTIRKAEVPQTYQTRAAVEQAVRAGHSFAPFDRNGDGVVAADEMVLVRLNSAPIGGRFGMNRGIGEVAIPGSSLRIGGRSVVAMDEGASFMTIAHEFLHQLGTLELYGHAGISQNLTTMGATVFPAEDDRQTFHLDPWHKLRLGWTAPQVFAINGAGHATTQIAASAASFSNKAPILLYDARRYDVHGRRGEYFLIEFRARDLANTTQHYDKDAASDGIVVWSVETDAAGHWLFIPAIGGTGADPSIFTFGAPDGARGGGAAWTEAHGAITLRYRDGTDAGVRLRVGPRRSGAHSVSVEWSPTGTLRPRLDHTDELVFGSSAFRLNGVFPASPTGVSVWMRPRGTLVAPVRLAIPSYTVTGLAVARPTGAPTGPHEIWIDNAGSRSDLRYLDVR